MGMIGSRLSARRISAKTSRSRGLESAIALPVQRHVELTTDLTNVCEMTLECESRAKSRAPARASLLDTPLCC